MNLGKAFRDNGLLSFALLVIISTLMFDILSKILSTLIFDFNVFSPNFLLSSLTVNQEVSFFRFSQPFQTVGIFLFPALVAGFFLKKKSKFKFSKFQIEFPTFLSSVLLMLVVKPIVSWLMYINSLIDFSVFGSVGIYLMNMSEMISHKVALITHSENIYELLLNIVVIAIIPAVSEEFFFRGIVQNYLIKITNKPHISILLSSIAFGLIHFNIMGVLPILFMGLILGYIYFYTENIWVSIFAHFINNASLLVFVYDSPIDVSKMYAESPSVNTILFSLVMSFSLLFFLYYVWENRKSKNLI